MKLRNGVINDRADLQNSRWPKIMIAGIITVLIQGFKR
jgi:hypothetical protein